MPLHITLIIVAFGISGTVLLVHLMGWTKTRQIGELGDASAIWNDFFPDETIASILKSDDEAVALLTLDSGALGLIWSLGDEPVVRVLRNPTPIAETAKGLRIRLAEFAAPHVDIRLSDPSDRTRWAAILSQTKEVA